ncbi:hypothetical protein F5148DRAFT_1161921 [Russula earlei]|uniref:Uncharacterized protein n=1 Tax=Russula earlei TaxID=71964 RepID=A0ACC0UN81_9AGAM|nr:hypothetical protein F5148DRAFT_1161921 [Russula earlei]
MRTHTILAFVCLAAGIVPSFAVPLMPPRGDDIDDTPPHQLSDNDQPGQPSGSNREGRKLKLMERLARLASVPHRLPPLDDGKRTCMRKSDRVHRLSRVPTD